MSLTATSFDDWDSITRDPLRADAVDYSPAAADARHLAFGDDDRAIPEGTYCYAGISRIEQETGQPPRVRMILCPFWGSDASKPDQQFGYCARLKAGDWEEDGTFLLWDQVKECGEKHTDEDGESYLSAEARGMA